MKYKVIGFILIFIIIGGVVLYFQQLNYYKKTRGNGASPTPSVLVSPAISHTPSASPVSTPTFEPTPGISPPPVASPTTGPQTEKTLKIEVTEDAAGLYESKAKKGTLVHFTISVTADSGAIEFKSGDITTGPIAPNSSKTIDFILDKTMVFVPHIVSSGKVGPYTVKITATE